MKNILLILISTAITSLNAQTFKYLGSYTSNGIPRYLECPSDTFSLQPSTSPEKDALTLKDGPWGLDYLDDYSIVTNFGVISSERKYQDNNYEIDRNANASGEVKGNINLFRHLLPDNQSLNTKDYSFINFKIKNNEPVEIIIMQDDDRDWANRLRYTVLANTEEKEYTISFNDFIDAEGNSADINTVKTVVFSIIGDYTNYKPFSINIKEMSFRKKDVESVPNFSSLEKKKLINYPNPFTNSTIIIIPTNSEEVQINVIDIMGRVVDVQKINTNSSNKIPYNAPKLKAGLYKYKIITDTNKQFSGTFVIN